MTSRRRQHRGRPGQTAHHGSPRPARRHRGHPDHPQHPVPPDPAAQRPVRARPLPLPGPWTRTRPTSPWPGTSWPTWKPDRDLTSASNHAGRAGRGTHRCPAQPQPATCGAARPSPAPCRANRRAVAPGPASAADRPRTRRFGRVVLLDADLELVDPPMISTLRQGAATDSARLPLGSTFVILLRAGWKLQVLPCRCGRMGHGVPLAGDSQRRHCKGLRCGATKLA